MSTRSQLMDRKIWKIQNTREATCHAAAGTGDNDDNDNDDYDNDKYDNY